MKQILLEVCIKTIRCLIFPNPDYNRCIITVEKKGWADHILTLKGELASTAMNHLKVGMVINAHTISTDKNAYKVTAIDFGE